MKVNLQLINNDNTILQFISRYYLFYLYIISYYVYCVYRNYFKLLVFKNITENKTITPQTKTARGINKKYIPPISRNNKLLIKVI